MENFDGGCCGKLINYQQMINEHGLKTFQSDLKERHHLDYQDFRHIAGFEVPRESCPREVPDAKPIPFPTMSPTDPVTYKGQKLGNLLPCPLNELDRLKPTMAPWPTSAWYSKEKHICGPKQTSVTIEPVETPDKKSIERPDGRCGPRFGNAQCDPGRCCSQWEYCGSNPSFCHNLSIFRNDGGEVDRVETSPLIPPTDPPLFTPFAPFPKTQLMV